MITCSSSAASCLEIGLGVYLKEQLLTRNIRQTLATESSTSLLVTGQSGRTETLNPNPSQRNHPTTMPALTSNG